MGVNPEAARAAEDVETLSHYEQLRASAELLLGGSGFSIRIDRQLPAVMAFSHAGREVLVNPERMKEKGMNDAERRFVFGHEIAHFVQLCADPDAYLGTFDRATERAEKAAAADQERVRQSWNRFYNVFLDIHDNAIVERRSPWMQRMSAETNPRMTLYANKFTVADLRGRAKTEQFLFSILRKAMLGPDAAVHVDDDVERAVGAPYSYLGRKHDTFYDFVRTKFFDPTADLGVLLSALERTAAPLFDAFLQMDLRNRKNLEDVENPDLNGEGIDEEGARKAAKEVKDARATGSAKAGKSADNRFTEASVREGFTPEQARTMLEIRNAADGACQDFIEVWGMFLHASQETRAVETGGYRTGYAPDVDSIVRALPRLQTEPDSLRPFLRRTEEPEREIVTPKRIELYLAIDQSGSMDKEKRRRTQEAAYALAMSLVQFQRNMAVWTQEDGQMPVDINVRIIGFGDKTSELLFRAEDEKRDGTLRAEAGGTVETRLWKAILAMSENLGGTQDAPALRDIADELSAADRAMGLEDRIAVVLEITDGETQTEAESTLLVDRINREPGTFARALQIPGLLSADTPPPKHDENDPPALPPAPTGTFQRVWRKNGVQLGSVNQLRTVALRTLADALQGRERES